MIPSAPASTPGPVFLRAFVFVRAFLRVVVCVVVGKCLLGEWNGVHHVLQIVVRGPFCSPGNDLSKCFRLDVGVLSGQTAGFLEEPGYLTRVLLVYPLRASVKSGLALHV